MDQTLLEYIRGLVPDNLPDGRELLKEGLAIGRSIQVERNKFLKKYGYQNYLEYRKDLVARGKINWQMLIGLSTLDEEIDAIRKVDEFADRTGIEVRTVQSIPSMLVGLPPAYWEQAPKPTSYVMRNPEDWMAHAEAAPIQAVFSDWHLSTPNSLATTVNALRTGTPRIGTFSQLIWNYPGYDDDVQRFSGMVRSLGIVAAKRDDFLAADSYPEDGIPGYFLDIVSYVGYMLFEHYIIEKLCGAKMSICLGGLLTEIQPRMALAMAFHKLMGTDDEPILSYINGGTIDQWDHDIAANYGTSVQEMLIAILVELKYKMCMAINPVAITEKLRVPTLQELLDIVSAGARVEEKAKEWLPLMNFQPLEQLRDDLAVKGTIFFNNIMRTFEAAGLDIMDPLQMIMALRNFNPIRFEMSFHPSLQEKGSFVPYHPSVLGRQTLKQSADIITDLIDKGYQGILKNRKAIAVSADGHSYGLMLVEKVLGELDCAVVNGGVDFNPVEVLDLADEEGTDLIFISIHCGQALDYSRILVRLARDRGKDYCICMGGLLNAVLPGHTEPTDVSSLLNDMGIIAENDFAKTISVIMKRYGWAQLHGV